MTALSFSPSKYAMISRFNNSNYQRVKDRSYRVMGKIIKIFIPVVIIAILLVGGYFYWQHQKFYPSTDDAYVQAHIVNIAPRIDGKIEAVYVQDHQHVKQGQPLFDIDPTPYKIALAKAQAAFGTAVLQYKAGNMAIKSAEYQVAEDNAQLVDTQSETRRMLVLVKKHYASESQGDLAVKNLHVAEASLKAAKSELAEAIQKRGPDGPQNPHLREAAAAVAQAKLNLQYTHVVAPASGYIANLDLRIGDVVTTYQQLFALIEDKSWWAEANYKETQLQRIEPGQTASIEIDMYPGQIFKGKVVSISDGSGTSFSLLPPENASGNWVKVTQRFPVKVLITERKDQYPLRLGASCTVTINTTQKQ